MSTDPALIRAIALFFPILATWALWWYRRPDSRQATSALLACAWAAPALLLLHVLAVRFGWWRFQAQGGTLLGIPVDLYLGWTLLWGAVPALAFPRLALPVVIGIMFGLDVVLMPSAEPLVQLSSNWWTGEFIGLALCLVPAQLLARWTQADRRLSERVTLLAIAYSSLMYGVLPTMILELTGGSWKTILDRPLWATSLGIQIVALPAILGLTAVQEFAARGGGTPIPFDPPKRRVTSGVYAYIANPMQLSTSLTLIGWGLLLGSLWVSAAGLMAFVGAAGVARWSEHRDLAARFGSAWAVYRQGVRNWWPRWRPWFPNANAGEVSWRPDRIYIAHHCVQCSAVARWLMQRNPIGLYIVAAERYPSRDLMRITYASGDGGPEEEGVAGLARALEHIHLGWALVGWAMRLPLVRPLLQLLVDAVGGEPRRIHRASNASHT